MAGNGDSVTTFRFGPAGGVIGRGAQCSWVLADPERILSKEHAAIRYQDGVFSLTALGRNGVFINGGVDPIASGVPVPLTAGDRLRLGYYDLMVDDILPGPASAAPRSADTGPKAPQAPAGPPVGPVPQPAAQPRVARPASTAGMTGSPRPPLSEDWESRLGELLRPAAANGVAAPPIIRPLGDLPPPTIVLQPASAPADTKRPQDGLEDQQSEWGTDGPLRALLLGRVAPAPAPAPAAPVRQERAWATEPRLFAEIGPELAERPTPASAPVEPAAMADGWTPPPLPPDAAFLRGLGIGLPQIGTGHAAAIAFDLGRALAALSDMLVELSHHPDTPRGNPFASLPTGPLALSELVASAAYRPGQIERMVRETIGEARRTRDQAAGRRAAAALDLSLLEPAKLLARWKLDPRRRDSGARAWALYETSFPALIEQARASAEPLIHPVTTPRTRSSP
jgi:type VI secretion system FHA domain protein